MATTHTIRDDEIPKLTDLIKKSPPRVTSEKRSVSSTAESKRETYAEKYSDLERTQTNGSGSEGKVPSGELQLVNTKIKPGPKEPALEPRIKSIKAFVGESDTANREDIYCLSKLLQRRHNANTLRGSVFTDLVRKKLVADRDLVAKAKVRWSDQSERKLYWVNLRKLTTETGWGHYESAIQILDNHDKLPFELWAPISGCQKDFPLSSVGRNFQNARIGRIFTIYKLLFIYGIFVAAAYNEQGGKMSPEKLREQLHRTILANTKYVYPIEVPDYLHSLLSECWLYRASKPTNVMLIPNSGYVFGGLMRPEAPYNRGLDCTSFIGWITGSGRPLTFLYAIAWCEEKGETPSRNVQKNAYWQKNMDCLKMTRERHKAVDPKGSEMRPGDILVWRHPTGSGHAMLVQRVVDDEHVVTVECTNYKDGRYEGFQERVVPIADPLKGRALVMRPLNQDMYYNFRNRKSALISNL